MFDARISLVDGMVHYVIENKAVSFRIADILLIGEFSAPPGQMAADYFFVFKVRGHEPLIEMPAYTDGLFPMLAELRRELPQLANPKLQMESQFNSRILFPAGLVDEYLFNFGAETKPWVNLPVLRNIKVQKVVMEVNPKVLVLN